MNSWITQYDPQQYTVHGAGYALHIAGHRVKVCLGGVEFATLDVRCAAPQTLPDDTGAVPDPEPMLPTLDGVRESDGAAVFTWTGRSTLWVKTYTLTCTRLHFSFTVTLHGTGRVDEIRYFSGDTGSEQWGSDYDFAEGFTPCTSWYNAEKYTFHASEDCHRWSVLMVPPMFCYAFRCTDSARSFGLGLVAQRGEHNFNAFDYRVHASKLHTGFCLTTDQSGHAAVNGTWTAPAIYGFAGDDEWDILAQYRDVYVTEGIAPPVRTGKRPRFWYGPMVCGWIEQCAAAAAAGRPESSMATEPFYEDLIRRVYGANLHPQALIIDDKWQTQYAVDAPDPAKFPDLRAFIDRRHAEGVRTLLWFKLWDAEGWDGPTITGANGDVRYDPSSPAFLAHLDAVLHRLLSADAGCCNCDGFKLDFAFWMPIGRTVHAASGKYGVELLYDLMHAIYTRAKAIKPDALINASPCHPYFADVCDHGRLHDYDYKNRNNRADMTMRARLYQAALPGLLLDTDNAGFAAKRDTMHWLLAQSHVGVPDLYALRGGPHCDLNADDLAAVAENWAIYSRRIDAELREMD